MPSDPLFAYLENLNAPRNVKADVWDQFHAAQGPADFEQRFSRMGLPLPAKADLFHLKYPGGFSPLLSGKGNKAESQPQKPALGLPSTAVPSTFRLMRYEPTAWDRIQNAIMGDGEEETLLGGLIHGVQNIFESKEDRYKRALTKPYNTERYAQGRGKRLFALEQLLPAEKGPFNDYFRDILKFGSELTDPKPLDALGNGIDDLLSPESREKLSPEDQQRVAKMTPEQKSGFITRRRLGRIVGAVNEPLVPINDFWREQMAKMPPEDRDKWYWRTYANAGDVVSDWVADNSSPLALTMMAMGGGEGTAAEEAISQGSRIMKLSPKAAAFMRKYGPKTVEWLGRVPAVRDAYNKMQEAREFSKKGNYDEAGVKQAEAIEILLEELIHARKGREGARGHTSHPNAGEGSATGTAPTGGSSKIPVQPDTGASSREFRARSEITRTPTKAPSVGEPVPRIPDRVKLRDEPKLQNTPAPVNELQKGKVGKKEIDSGRQIVQPTASPIQNERLAAHNAPQLDTQLSQISARVPGTSFERLRPQKNLERLQQKIDEGKPAQTISDYLAAQIAADTPKAKDQIIRELRREFDVIQVDDMFLKGRPDKGGYPSANVQVAFPGGGTAEVQIVPRETQEITDATHHLYTEGRNARDAGDGARARQAFNQARKLNREALDQFQLRNELSKGQAVTLVNGSKATIQYISPTMNVARVRTAAGKTRTVRLNQIQKTE